MKRIQLHSVRLLSRSTWINKIESRFGIQIVTNIISREGQGGDWQIISIRVCPSNLTGCLSPDRSTLTPGFQGKTPDQPREFPTRPRLRRPALSLPYFHNQQDTYFSLRAFSMVLSTASEQIPQPPHKPFLYTPTQYINPRHTRQGSQPWTAFAEGQSWLHIRYQLSLTSRLK